VVTDVLRPNGLAFAPDGGTLYVSETGATHDAARLPEIRAYPLLAGGAAAGPGRRFATCDAGFFDGLRCDTAGNVWTSAGDGVRCHAPDGTLIGRIPVPETVSNLCFGGPKRNRLFITAHTSLYAIYVNTRGA
jgi:gluconolactonase